MTNVKFVLQKEKGSQTAALSNMYLLLDDLQNFHGASLDTDAAGDALGDGIAFLVNHDLHGAHGNTGAAADTELLVDHVHTGLGILGDSAMLTSLHALTALDAGIDLGCAVLTLNDLDCGIIGTGLLIESLSTGLHALQTCHTFHVLLCNELLHRKISFIIYYR